MFFSVIFVDSIPAFDSFPLFSNIVIELGFVWSVCIIHFLGCCSVKHFVQFCIELIACLFETIITINDWWGVVLFHFFPC